MKELSNLSDDAWSLKYQNVKQWQHPERGINPDLQRQANEADTKWIKRAKEFAADELGPPNPEDLADLAQAARLACPPR